MPKAVLLAIIALIALVPSVAMAEDKIVYSNSYPIWYSYDCTDASPTSFTAINPTNRQANSWKYFSYYDGNGSCYVTLQTFDLSDLNAFVNATSMTYYVDTKGIVLTNQTANSDYQVNCELYYLGDVDAGSDLSLTPTVIASAFDCTGTAGAVIESTIPFSVANNSTISADILAGTYDQSFMLFPTFDTSDRASWDSNNYEYVIGKFANEYELQGHGWNCITIEASNWCNLYNEPWEAIKKSLGEDYIGDWFYVLIFLPFPFSVFLITRNGAYAGFISLPIMLTINTIDQVIFEVSLSMILIAGAFGFYELLRKKLHE